MKKLLLLSQCSLLLLVAAGSLPAAAEDVPRRFQTCRSSFVQPNVEHPASATPTQTPQPLIQRNCVNRIHRFRTGTALCGLDEYGQPTLGEFRQFETRQQGRTIRSQPQLVRCL
ncbi:hypothetical protein [Almyronema epifaneia]|uniref:Uncharacterized protein n=1 Tax=Almyronema epifaneia S1 TaxID=2991925 RepID=A0ABW6IJM3_9CYAN